MNTKQRIFEVHINAFRAWLDYDSDALKTAQAELNLFESTCPELLEEVRREMFDRWNAAQKGAQ